MSCPRLRKALVSPVSLWVSFVVLTVSTVTCQNYSERADDRQRREREEAVALERRIVARSQDYANCQENNAQNLASGKTYDNLFIAAVNAPPNPNSPLTPEERLYNLSRSLDILRGQLTVSNCDATLSDLTPEQAERAKSRANSIPRSPLPVPTVPGYVPPTTTPD